MLQSIMDFDLRAVKAMGLKSDHLILLHWFERERAYGATSVIHNDMIYTPIEPTVVRSELPCIDQDCREILKVLDEKNVLQSAEITQLDGSTKRFWRVDINYIALTEAYIGDY